MARQYPILQIEAAPGDPPRAVEQLNGDLLLPACARPLIEKVLLQAEAALATGEPVDRDALEHARQLLGIDRPDPARARLHANLLKVRPI